MFIGNYLPSGKFVGDLFPGDTFFDHEDHSVVQKIRNLVFDFFFVRVLGSNDDLCALFANFFEDLVNALVEEIVGVGSFLRMKFAVGDDIIYILEYMKRIGVVGFLLNQRFEETASAAGMAGRSDLIYFCKNRVVVTIKSK